MVHRVLRHDCLPLLTSRAGKDITTIDPKAKVPNREATTAVESAKEEATATAASTSERIIAVTRKVPKKERHRHRLRRG